MSQRHHYRPPKWTALSLALAALPTVLFAHGSMEDPISRIYACYKENPENPSSPACVAAAAYSKPALYDWMSVRIGDVAGNHQGRIPDGRLCSAGDATFGALDAARDDWPATPIAPDANGRLQMRFHATAPHSTDYIRVYATGPSYDPNRPLAWSDLQPQPFCELQEAQIGVEDNRYLLDCPFPAGVATGRQLLYAIWQRADSPEAFYACSDVIVGDVVDPVDPIWREVGVLSAETDLESGSTISFRLFNAAGNDAETHDVVVEGDDALRNAWPKALAETVNASSGLVAIGQLADGVVTPVVGANANRVYVNDDQSYSFVVDVTLPPVQPPPDGDTWRADLVYVAGDRVVYQGVEYEAKWWTQGEVPGASAVWKRMTPSDGPTEWNAGAVYTAGDQVVHQGADYEARWWTQGDEPGTHEVWTLLP
jgi:chitin-binding protein